VIAVAVMVEPRCSPPHAPTGSYTPMNVCHPLARSAVKHSFKSSKYATYDQRVILSVNYEESRFN